MNIVELAGIALFVTGIALSLLAQKRLCIPDLALIVGAVGLPIAMVGSAYF